MDDLDAKRVFDARVGGNMLVVAAESGLYSVAVAADRLGRVSLEHRCTPRAIAAGSWGIAVATDDDLLLRRAGRYEPTGFGPAVAVGGTDRIVAAGPSGNLAIRTDDETWTDLGDVPAEIRAIDPPLIAAADGVYRLPGPTYVGLNDARAVAASDPLVATGAGLYTLGNGWRIALEGAFELVTAAEERAHAATAERWFERGPTGWELVDSPAGHARIVDVGYADRPYAIAANGTLYVDGSAGWRTHPLGIPSVVGCAVVERRD